MKTIGKLFIALIILSFGINECNAQSVIRDEQSFDYKTSVMIYLYNAEDAVRDNWGEPYEVETNKTARYDVETRRWSSPNGRAYTKIYTYNQNWRHLNKGNKYKVKQYVKINN